MADERLEKIRARVARLRAAGPIDLAADPAVNALRVIAMSDADDLAYLLDENARLWGGTEGDVWRLREQVRSISALAAEARQERDQARAELVAARKREERLLDENARLRAALERHGDDDRSSTRPARPSTSDRLSFTPRREMRASWSTCERTPGRFTGVIKEAGTDAWLWQCDRALHHAHETRKDAIACARERIAKEAARGQAG